MLRQRRQGNPPPHLLALRLAPRSPRLPHTPLGRAPLTSSVTLPSADCFFVRDAYRVVYTHHGVPHLDFTDMWLALDAGKEPSAAIASACSST